MRIEAGTIEAAKVKAVYVDDVQIHACHLVDDELGFAEFTPKDEHGRYLIEGEEFATKRVYGSVRIER